MKYDYLNDCWCRVTDLVPYVAPLNEVVLINNYVDWISFDDNLYIKKKKFVLPEIIWIEDIISFEERFYLTEYGPRFFINQVTDSVFFNSITKRLYIIEKIIKKPVNFILLWDPGKNFTLIKDQNLSLIIRPCFSLTNIYKSLTQIYDINYLTANIKDFNLLYDDILIKLRQLFSINLARGYVRDVSIFNKDEYYIIAEYADILVDPVIFEKLKAINKIKVFNWLGQLALLNIFTSTNKVLSRLAKIQVRENSYEADVLLEITSRFNILKSQIISYLDISIKQHFRKRVILLNAGIYAGFDTEYLPLDYGKNKLLSAQLSFTGCLKVDVPVNKDFIFEGVNSFTSEIYIKTPPIIGEKTIILHNSIDSLIKENQELIFGNHYYKMQNIIKNLYNDPNLDNVRIEKDKSVSFQFKKTPIKNKFIIAKPGENLKIKFNTLINIINDNINLKAEITRLCNKIDFYGSELCWTLPEIINKTTDSWNSKSLIQEPAETIILSNEENNVEHKKSNNKKLFTGNNINLRLNKNIYLCAHYNAADLSMLEDWEKVSRQNIDILKKSFISLTKPMEILNEKVYIRDTLLLSSVTAATLKAVGKAHGLTKLDLDRKWVYQMDNLLKSNFELFKAYAMQDSLITLIHALFMNDFSFNLGIFNLPNTLGSLTTKYMKNKWAEDKYRGYQINAEYPLGNIQKSINPLGIRETGTVAENINLYLSSFRGGRNECFKYGVDKNTKWFDYDLTSCYATIMSMCGDPNYEPAPAATPSEGLPFATPIDLPPKSSSQGGLPPLYPLPGGDPLIKEETEVSEETSVRSEPANETEVSEENSVYDSSGISALPGKTQHFEKNLSEFFASSNKEALNFDEDELEKIPPIDIAALCGDPGYEKSHALYPNSDLSKLDLINSYSSIQVKFCFPSSIKFPPIPVHLDKSITIYPLSGESTITGLEFLAAKNLLEKSLLNYSVKYFIPLEQLNKEYFVNIIYGYYIPFKKLNENIIKKPFYNTINDLQIKRRHYGKLFGKKSAMERIYKDLGNMLYGKVVSGLSNKKSYDSRLLQMVTLSGNYITNPIIGGWITGFVRSLISEMLNAVNELGGNVVACTTDGFVCDIENLEQKLIDFLPKSSLLFNYRNIREKLSGDPSALEVKTSVRGIIQWTTRGQLSLDHSETGYEIAAMTGFQKFQFKHKDLVDLVSESMLKDNKILFLQKRLSGSKDNYKFNNDVSMLSSLRKFRTVFDTKRLIIESQNTMLDTAPFLNFDEALMHRNLLTIYRQGIYSHKYSQTFISSNSSSILLETTKFFVRMYCSHFNWIMNLDQKIFLINLIKNNIKWEFNINYKTEYLMNLINTTLLNPGINVSQLTIYKNNLIYVKTLYEEIIKWVPEILPLFCKTFDNFLKELNIKWSTCLDLVPYISPEEKEFELLKLRLILKISKISFNKDNVKLISSML